MEDQLEEPTKGEKLKGTLRLTGGVPVVHCVSRVDSRRGDT